MNCYSRETQVSGKTGGRCGVMSGHRCQNFVFPRLQADLGRTQCEKDTRFLAQVYDSPPENWYNAGIAIGAHVGLSTTAGNWTVAFDGCCDAASIDLAKLSTYCGG
jgi:hypothetical protein